MLCGLRRYQQLWLADDNRRPASAGMAPPPSDIAMNRIQRKVAGLINWARNDNSYTVPYDKVSRSVRDIALHERSFLSCRARIAHDAGASWQPHRALRAWHLMLLEITDYGRPRFTDSYPHSAG